MVIKELRSPEKKVAVVADKCIPLSPKKYHVETKNTSKSSLLERVYISLFLKFFRVYDVVCLA